MSTRFATYVTCDRCDREMYGDETVYITGCQSLCAGCVKDAALDALVDVSFDELLDDDYEELKEPEACKCERCGKKHAKYRIDGENLCGDCMKKYAVEGVELNGDPMEFLDYREMCADDLAEDEYIADNEGYWMDRYYGEC